VLRPGQGLATVALMAIPIVLVARWVAVALPVTALRLAVSFRKGTIPVLTWGGVRGGISIALDDVGHRHAHSGFLGRKVSDQ
jgi:CPA1 family monovalent cation:H+ antiporter